MNSVQQFLENHAIEHTWHEHPAVFTCEEAAEHCQHVGGIASKNLFLKGRKTKQFFLVVLPAYKRADIKKIGTLVGDKDLSFASFESLFEYLQLTPGSVSPFGLINDLQNRVRLFIDEEIYNANTVSFHPNRNTASIELSNEMFHTALSYLCKSYTVITL